MASTFHYQVFRSRWGIVVWLTADARLYADFAGSPTEVAERIWLSVEVNALTLTDQEYGYLRLGLRIVADDIRRSTGDGLPVVIRVIDIKIAHCDYQEEGLAGAMAGWAAREYGFREPDIRVNFDREKNRYVFDFGPYEEHWDRLTDRPDA